MFEFLRKGPAHTKPVRPAAPERKAVAPPPTVESHEPKTVSGAENSGIDVQEMDAQLPPEIEQAVMHYADGKTDQAVSILNRFIFDHPDYPSDQAWHLLFDLYELSGQQQQFEELALDYAVRYERSPPTWREPAPSARGQAKDYPSFTFSANLAEHDAVALERCRAQWELADAVLLDFSKVLPPEDDYADFILDILGTVEGQDKAVRLAGAEAFVVRLNAARAGGKLGRAGWLLLLRLLQLQGLVEAFDEVALDYAVAFELSPPSYVAPVYIAVQADSDEAAPDGEAEPEPNADAPYALHGVLSMASTEQFEKLRHFAQPLNRVVISLADVPRIDFTAVGLILDSAMTLATSGKQIEFVAGNGMVNLMLQMTGLGQFATLRQETRK